jgi:hypothetical protein
MRVSTLVRPIALMVALASLAACSDSAVAPRQAVRSELRPLGFTAPPTLRKSAATVDVDIVDNDEVEFTIDPNQQQNVYLGSHTISFPAHSICDPETSSYGPEYWDAPCRAAHRPIKFRAKWSVSDGHARVDFEPSVRFVPPSSPWNFTDWVILSIKEPKALQVDRNYEILWKGSNGGWVDESKTDPTLRAWSDWTGNRVSRRIKHFSGYNVTAGFMDIDVGVDVRSGW